MDYSVSNAANQDLPEFLKFFEFNLSAAGGFGANVSHPDDLEIEIVGSVTVGVLLTLIAVGAVFGNGLVIVSVYTNRRLRTITNCFVVSLATSDLLVGLLVLPLSVKVEVTGAWRLGAILCDMWISCDVMLCSSSILNLCCISLDRYFAITNPLVYATKRSKRLALIMIAVVWLLSIAITLPPIFGWQEAGRWADDAVCHLTQDPGYVIFSALWSFYMPMVVMLFVYFRIFQVTRKRAKMLKPLCRTFTFEKKKQLKLKQGQGNTLYHHASQESDCESQVQGQDSRSDPDDKYMETTVYRADNKTDTSNGHKTATPVATVIDLHGEVVVSTALAMTDVSRQHARGNGNAKRKSSAAGDASPPSDTACDRPISAQRPSSNHSASDTPVRGRASDRDYFARREERRRERAALQRESKTAKTLAVVVGCFIICWLPFFLMYLVEPFCSTCDIDPRLQSFITWLGYCNSVINPFIYAFYNHDFRHTFYKLTCNLITRRFQ